MTSLGLDVGDFAEAEAALASRARTPLCIALDGKIVGLVALADPIKSTTPVAIAALRQLGLKVAMITGDNRRAAEAIAAELGIDEVVAEGKVAALKTLREGGVRWPLSGSGSTMPRRWPRRMWPGRRHRHRRRYRKRRRRADGRRPGRRAEGHRPVAGRAAQHPAEPVLGLRLQRRAEPGRGRCALPAERHALVAELAADAMALSSVFVLGNALRLKRYAPVSPAPLARGQTLSTRLS